MYPPAAAMIAAGTTGRKAGWLLSAAELASIVARLPGSPIIMDHTITQEACRDPRPTREAIEALGREQFLKTQNPDALLKCPVGRVTSAFVDGRGAARVTFTLCRGVAAIVKRGLYAWLSLSHFAGSTEPLEVSVTPSPGRPGCAIDAVIKGPSEYKVMVAAKANATTMEPTASPSPLETIMASLSPADRELVAARMVDLQKAANEATEAQKKAEAAKQELMTADATEQDYKALDMVVGQLVDKIDHERYNVNPAMYNYSSRNDPEKLRVRNLESILCACNRALSETAPVNNNAQSGEKRKRTESAAPERQNALAGSTEEALLAQALEVKFSAGERSPW